MDSLVIRPLIDPNAGPSDPGRAVERNQKQDEAYAKLLASKTKAAESGSPHLWNYFDPKRVEDPKDLVKLQCIHCKRMISARNPSNSMASHLGGRNCNTAGTAAKVSYAHVLTTQPPVPSICLLFII